MDVECPGVTNSGRLTLWGLRPQGDWLVEELDPRETSTCVNPANWNTDLQGCETLERWTRRGLKKNRKYLKCTHQGGVILKNKKLHILICAKLLKDPNSKISCLYIDSFLGRKASENVDCYPKMTTTTKCCYFF